VRRRRAVHVAAAALALALGARGAAAQTPGGRCALEFENTPTSRFNAQKVAGTEQYNSFLGGGVIAHCSGQQVTLKADSAEYYGVQGTLYLIGTVSYVEPRVRVNSQRMTYFQADERLLAEGNVDAVLPSGTTMRGPQAEYFREIPAVRPRPRLIAPGRPTFNIVQADSTGRPGEPTALVADRVTADGDSLVYAGGRVEIDRTDISARGDSAFLDSGTEFARLMRGPSIAGKGERPFTLRGSVLDLFSRERQLQRVVASMQAEAVSQDLKLTSDSIDMRVTGGQLDRAYVWGKSRARAVSPERDIIADSIDVRLPGQRVREVRALRGAYASTVPDTARFRSNERDWLRGDTIVARFDSTAVAAGRGPRAPGDSARSPRIRQLEATGSARSFYQIAPQRRDSAGRPGVNYVSGKNIVVAFNGQSVQTVTVLGSAAGVYLEPTDDTTQSTAPARGTRAGPGGAPTRPTAPRPASPAARPPAPAAGSRTTPSAGRS
jgi:hypothetical protein